MRFDAWFLIALLPLVPALLLLYAHASRHRRRALAQLVEAELAPRILPRIPTGHRLLRATCLVGAVACLIVALMQPQWGAGQQDLVLRGRDIVVVLDVSLSMLAEDAEPSRLARAKAAARSLVEALQAEGGHRLGLLTFAGRADVQAPFTRDYALFLDRLEAAGVEDVAQRGSSIGGALLQSLGAFGELDPGYTDLILFSDGEDHGNQALEAARLLAERGFTLYTVGVGNPDAGVPIPIVEDGRPTGHLLYQGQIVETRARRGLLTAMADAAGGIYVPVDNGSASLDRLYRERIADKPRRQMGSSSNQQMEDRFQIFVALAILLLGLEVVMRDPKGGGA